MLQMISISNNYCSFEHFIHQKIQNKCIKVSTKTLSSTTVSTYKKKNLNQNQHIRMISKPLRDRIKPKRI